MEAQRRLGRDLRACVRLGMHRPPPSPSLLARIIISPGFAQGCMPLGFGYWQHMASLFERQKCTQSVLCKSIYFTPNSTTVQLTPNMRQQTLSV
jgi:hypothetical protein